MNLFEPITLDLDEIKMLAAHRAAALVAQGDPIAGDPLLDKLTAEQARLQQIADQVAKAKAESDQYAANREYAKNHLKTGDVVEYTQYAGTGKNRTYGKITRTMQVLGVSYGRNRSGGTVVHLRGVVLTKSGKPHGTLNRDTNPYIDVPHRAERGISPMHIKLIKAA